MMGVAIRKFTKKSEQVQDPQFAKSASIIKYAHETSHAIFKGFCNSIELRGATRGSTTDEEQDLLRAMLVLAASGLDSFIKQIIRDTMPCLAMIDDKVKNGMEKFVARMLKKEGSDSSDGSDGNPKRVNEFLARILTSDQPQGQVIQEYIKDLTGSSLQSESEVMKAVYALGLNPDEVNITPGELAPIFAIRNKIIHEMDINFDAPKRNREIRRKTFMVKSTNTLLKASEDILLGVQKKIDTHP